MRNFISARVLADVGRGAAIGVGCWKELLGNGNDEENCSCGTFMPVTRISGTSFARPVEWMRIPSESKSPWAGEGPMARTRTPSKAAFGCRGGDVGRIEVSVKEVKEYPGPFWAEEGRG